MRTALARSRHGLAFAAFAAALLLPACAKEATGPEMHAISGHVKLTGYLVHNDGTFAGTKVVGDADGVRVNLIFGTQLIRTTTTVDGVYRFPDVPQGGYKLSAVAAETVGDTTRPVTVARQNVAVSDTLRLFAAGDIRPVPNPRVDSTRIYFVLPDTQQVEIRILNLSGGLVRAVWSGVLEGGLTSVFWDGFASGGVPANDPIYWVAVRSGSDRRAHLLFRDPGAPFTGRAGFFGLRDAAREHPR